MKKFLFLLLSLWFTSTHADEGKLFNINELGKKRLKNICVEGLPIFKKPAKDEDSFFFLINPKNAFDNNDSTPEGLHVKMYSSSWKELPDIKSGEIVKICGNYKLFNQKSFLKSVKYNLEGEAFKIHLSYSDGVDFRSITPNKKITITTRNGKLPETFLQEDMKDEKWLQKYENMLVSVTSAKVVKGHRDGLKDSRRFYAKIDNLTMPIQISAEFNFLPQTKLKPFKAIVKEDMFNMALLPIETLEKENEVPAIILEKLVEYNSGIRLASYNVKNLEPITQEDARSLCLNSQNLTVTASKDVQSFIDRENKKKPNSISAKSEYCSIVSFNTRKEKFDKIAKHIVENLGNPDVLALQEIQDNDGAFASDILGADDTLLKLVDAIKEQGGKDYIFNLPSQKQDDVLAPKVFGEFGGQAGGNIRNAFLLKKQFIDEKAKNIKFVGGIPESAGKIKRNPKCDSDIGKEIFHGARAPAGLEFTYHDNDYLLLNLHLSSNFRGRTPAKIKKRYCQLKVVQKYVDSYLTSHAKTKIILTGDFNDPPESESFIGLTNYKSYVTQPPQITHSHNGHGQQYDYMYSLGITEKVTANVLPLNAEYVEAHSDHNPVILDIEK